MNLKTYKGFTYLCENQKSEERLQKYIDFLGDNPSELPNVSEENFEQWHCDYDFAGVTTLYLPENIKRIGKCVFAQSKIKNVFANGVELIDELAFYQTHELNVVSAPKCKYLVATDLETGEFTEFADCFNHSWVKTLDLPSVEIVGRYCFYDMPFIESLNLPKVNELAPHAIYGNEKLEFIFLDSLEDAKASVITMNPKLKEVYVPSLRRCHKASAYSNGGYIDFSEAITYEDEPIENHEIFTETDLKKIGKKEKIEYEYEIENKGVKFNLIDGLSEEEKEIACQKIAKGLEYCFNIIPNSYNIEKNESAKEQFKNIKDIYLPEQYWCIGDYAFAKCYGLESIVAPGVKEVHDHAFYCDSKLRYVDLPKCKKLFQDAFNGASFAYGEDPSKGIAKIFIPEVEEVQKHAFWQTGFRVLNMPKCKSVAVSAIEENSILQAVRVQSFIEKGYAKNHYSLINNPNLQIVHENGDVIDEFHVIHHSAGCPLLYQKNLTPSSELE